MTSHMTVSHDRLVIGHHMSRRDCDIAAGGLAVDETVSLLPTPLPLVGVSIVMERERQQNDSLVNG